MLKYFLIANIILSLSYGTIINVGSEEIHDFNSIQDGIDSAQIGDTVLVHSGIYYENIIIDKTNPINLPSSSTRPLECPKTPLNNIYKKPSPSKNKLIYCNNSITNLFAILPSTLPLLFCIIKDITFPMSERLFAEV